MSVLVGHIGPVIAVTLRQVLSANAVDCLNGKTLWLVRQTAESDRTLETKKRQTETRRGETNINLQIVSQCTAGVAMQWAESPGSLTTQLE